MLKEKPPATQGRASMIDARPSSADKRRVAERVRSLAPTVFCPPTNIDRCLGEIPEARRTP